MAKEKKLAPLPLIRGKRVSALKLLQHVLKLELDEPKRLYMGMWTKYWRKSSVVLTGLPACGTVCCHAGWINANVDPARNPFLSFADLRALDVIVGSENVPMRQALDRAFYWIPKFEASGTMKYVRAAQRPLIAFMKKYRKELAARMVDLAPRPKAEGRA